MNALRVHQILTDKVLVSRESARLLGTELKALFAPNAQEPACQSITIDFHGVEGIAPSFMDELLNVFENLAASAHNGAAKELNIANPPARLSSKFQAIARGHGLSIQALPDGSWIFTTSQDPQA